MNFVLSNRIPVASKPNATTVKFVKNDLKRSWKVNPMIAVGIEPKIMYIPSFPSGLLKSLLRKALMIFNISLWKTKKITNNVAKCKRML